MTDPGQTDPAHQVMRELRERIEAEILKPLSRIPRMTSTAEEMRDSLERAP